MKDNGSARTIGGFPSAGRDHWRSLSSLTVTTRAGTLPGFRRLGLPGRLPVPRQQRIELVPFGPSRHDAFKYISQPGQRFDTIQFCRLHERRDDRPVPSAVVVSGEKRVLPGYRYRSDGALNGVGIELDAAIFEEHDQSVPVVQRVTDRLGQGGSTRDAAELFGEPDMHGLNERPALFMAHT